MPVDSTGNNLPLFSQASRCRRAWIIHSPAHFLQKRFYYFVNKWPSITTIKGVGAFALSYYSNKKVHFPKSFEKLFIILLRQPRFWFSAFQFSSCYKSQYDWGHVQSIHTYHIQSQYILITVQCWLKYFTKLDNAFNSFLGLCNESFEWLSVFPLWSEANEWRISIICPFSNSVNTPAAKYC